jgi:DNA (cytosine-5)-methyltransferase 1
MTFTYFSMFSGIGGFELGIQKAFGDKNRGKQPRKKWEHKRNDVHVKGKCKTVCVGFSEIDKHAIQIYQRHYPEHRNYGDATKIDPKELPDFDMLCGGFPCQSFSVAGKRQGFKDTRGTLFFEICRIASEKRPRMLFLENVEGLLNHDGGQTFQTIISTMDELGYDVEWQVLNSKNFGVPQNRKRVFIIGHLRTKPLCRHQIFPLGESNTRDTDAQEETRGIGSRVRGNHPHLRVGGGNNKALVAEALQERDYKGGQLIMRTPLKYMNRNQRNIEGDYSFTVDGANTGGISDGVNIRRLTPVECERLQGFPDGWTSDISDTQRYKCLRNAVTVNVIEAIASQIMEALI